LEGIIPTTTCLPCWSNCRFQLRIRHFGYVLLDTSDADIDSLQEFVLSALEEELRAGVTENNQATVLAEIKRSLTLSSYSVWLKSLGETVYEAYLQPTNVADAIETPRAQEKAASEVETVYLARGSVLVEAGQTVTSEQMDLLLSLDLVKGAEATSHLAPGVIAYLFCVYVLMLAYLASFEQETFASTKK
jgi:membrane-associated HD superfamily phosphohydrolase